MASLFPEKYLHQWAPGTVLLAILARIVLLSGIGILPSADRTNPDDSINGTKNAIALYG